MSCPNDKCGDITTFGQSPQNENRLKKLIRIWRALHEYVNFVHDPEKQYRSLSGWSAAGVVLRGYRVPVVLDLEYYE